MKRKSPKNNNKALQGVFGLVILVGAVLGLTAFILHFTNKKDCGEGYTDGPGPSLDQCQLAKDNGQFQGQVACCGPPGTCKLGDVCGWFGRESSADKCLDTCANYICASRNCNLWHCAPQPGQGKTCDFCNDPAQCESKNCTNYKCMAKSGGKEGDCCNDPAQCESGICTNYKCVG